MRKQSSILKGIDAFFFLVIMKSYEKDGRQMQKRQLSTQDRSNRVLKEPLRNSKVVAVGKNGQQMRELWPWLGAWPEVTKSF